MEAGNSAHPSLTPDDHLISHVDSVSVDISGPGARFRGHGTVSYFQVRVYNVTQIHFNDMIRAKTVSAHLSPSGSIVFNHALFQTDVLLLARRNIILMRQLLGRRQDPAVIMCKAAERLQNDSPPPSWLQLCGDTTRPRQVAAGERSHMFIPTRVAPSGLNGLHLIVWINVAKLC